VWSPANFVSKINLRKWEFPDVDFALGSN